MGSWTQKTVYRGKTVNLGLLYILKAANTILASKRFGGETSPVTIVQGCFHKGVSASAGTHDGSDVMDITPYNWKNREKVFRILGFALYHRPTLPGEWGEHMHGISDGVAPDPKCVKGPSPSAGRQIVAYHNRRNGLANNGPDTGYKMLVFPLFVFPEKPEGKPGKMWTTKSVKAYEQPTTKADVYRSLKAKTQVNTVAVVRVGSSYWAVTDNGECIPMTSLSRTAPKPGSVKCQPSGTTEEPKSKAPVEAPKAIGASTVRDSGGEL